MQLTTNYLSSVLLCFLFLFAVGCPDQRYDARYEGWNRYLDKDDGYEILIPSDWIAEDDTIVGFRSTRFFPTDKYSGEMSGFVYFSVTVKVINESQDPSEQAREVFEKMTAGMWKNVSYNARMEKLSGKEAAVFDIQGDPYYSQFKLQGRLYILEHRSKVFALYAAATNESFDQLAHEFEMITNSFRLP